MILMPLFILRNRNTSNEQMSFYGKKMSNQVFFEIVNCCFENRYLNLFSLNMFLEVKHV